MSLYADYRPTEQVGDYRYSPTFAVAFTPLAYLPWPCSGIAWGIGSIAVLLVALHLMAREMLPGTTASPEATYVALRTNNEFLRIPPAEENDVRLVEANIRQRHEGFFLMLALAGSSVGIWSGQTNAMVTALMILGLVAILRHRWWTAAFLLAAPVFIKLWPLAMVLLLLTFWPRQLSGRFLLACTMFALVPFLTRPPATVAWQYCEWYRALTGPLQERWSGYRDAWTIWNELWPPVHDRIYRALRLATAAGAFGWCVWQRRRTTATNLFLMQVFSIWASWQLLFGPGTEQLTYGIIAPATSWAVLVACAEKKARWLTLTAWAMSALLASGDIEHAVCQVFPAGTILLPSSVVLFLAWLLWHESGPIESAGMTASLAGTPVDCTVGPGRSPGCDRR